jgi:carboxylesterase
LDSAPVNKPGVVCVHGLGGTPHSVLPLTAAVHGAGYDTVAPKLPGHGTAPTDLIGLTWQDWLDTVRAVTDELAARTGTVVLVGQSMGATLALHVALADPAVRGVAAINPLVLPADPDATEHLEHLVGRGRTMQPAGEPDLRDPGAHDSAYPELTLTALIQLARCADAIHPWLGDIRVPLLVASSDHDNVVDPANADELATRAGGPVTRLFLANSGHVAALDFDRHLLSDALLTWLADLTDESAAPG